MKPFYQTFVFFLFFTTTTIAQADLGGFTNQEIVTSELDLHHFMEDYNLDRKILIQTPSFVISSLDKQIYLELVKNNLPNKADVLFQLLKETLVEEDLKDFYNKNIDKQISHPSFEATYNAFKQSYISNSQQGWRASSRTAGQACVNIDFETGDWTGWDTDMGRSCTGGIPDCYSNSTPGSNTGDANNLRRHLVVGAGADPSVPALSTLSPFGGTSSLRLGNQAAGYGAEKISHTFLVITGQEIFTYAFAVVLQDPGTSHAIDYKPFFGIKMFDAAGNDLVDTCAHYNVTAGTGKPGFQSLGTIEWKDWSQISVDLTAYIGQNVTIEFTTSDCDYGGHWGRAYLDATCSQPEIDVTTGCTGVELQGPGGYYGYTWRDVTTGAILGTNPLLISSGTGHYSLDLVSENGCVITLDTIINIPYVALSHNSVVTSITCFGDGTGQIDVNATGGAAPYTYSIDNGATFVIGDVFSNLTAGNYSVIVRDASGCLDSTFNYTITEPAPLGVNLTLTDASCFGLCDGSALAAPFGGTPINGGYLYSWNSAPDVTRDVDSNLCAGAYTVRVTDSNGCFLDTNYTINEPVQLILSNVNLVDELCYNSCLGEININEPTGVLFSIDGGVTYQASGNFDSLCAASSPFFLSMQDATGCVMRDTVVLNQSSTNTILASNDTLICYGTSVTLTANMTGGNPGYTYTWYDGAVQLGTGATYLASPTVLTTYTVIGADANGCQASEDVVVDVMAQLQVAAYADTTICEGGSAQMYAVAIGGNGNFTFTWNNGVGVGQNVNVSPIVTTNYIVTVSDGCSNPNAQDSVLVIVSPGLTLDNVGLVNELCYNSCLGEININEPAAVLFSIDGGSSYQASGFFDSLCAASSPFYLSVQDALGCVSQDTVVLTQPTANTIQVSVDTLVCYGTSATLVANMGGGTPGYNYTWYDGITQLQVGNTFVASPTALITYTVIATDANGCQLLEDVDVDVMPQLQVAAYSDATICAGDSVQMYAQATGGNGNYTYSWDNGGGISQFTTVFPIVTTNYTVTVSDGCSVPDAQDSVLITVNQLPQVTFQADTNEGCVPTEIEFANLTLSSNVSLCFWEFGDGAVSNTCGIVSHTYSDTGVFDVRLTVTSPQGCVSDSFALGMIWVHPNPIADFEATPWVTDVFDTRVEFTNNSTLADFNSWTFDTHANSTAVDTVIVFPTSEGSTYDVCLEVKTVYGCTNQICKPVIVEDKSYLFVPNTFTPDGDGKNDGFFPHMVGIDRDDFVFYVFDRWGDLIFQTDRYGNEWDGRFRGKMGQQDAYVWKVEARSLETGNMIEKMGHIVLLK